LSSIGSKKNYQFLTTADRRMLIEKNNSDITIGRQAKLLGLSRSGLYYQPIIDPNEILIKEAIDRIYTDYPFFGSRKMRFALQDYDKIFIGRDQVRRLMREMGIEAIYPEPKNLSEPQSATPKIPVIYWLIWILLGRIRFGVLISPISKLSAAGSIWSSSWIGFPAMSSLGRSRLLWKKNLFSKPTSERSRSPRRNIPIPIRAANTQPKNWSNCSRAKKSRSAWTGAGDAWIIFSREIVADGQIWKCLSDEIRKLRGSEKRIGKIFWFLQ